MTFYLVILNDDERELLSMWLTESEAAEEVTRILSEQLDNHSYYYFLHRLSVESIKVGVRKDP